MMIAPLLYDKATAEEKKILEEQYGVKRFPINTIRLERIFADKILAAEFYYQRELYFDVAKHMFDLAIMMEQPQIKILQFKPEILVEMLHYKRMEEQERIGSDLAQKPFSEFCLFAEMRENSKLEAHFMKMQRIYIFDERAMLTYDEAVQRLEKLNDFLLSLDEGLDIPMPAWRGWARWPDGCPTRMWRSPGVFWAISLRERKPLPWNIRGKSSVLWESRNIVKNTIQSLLTFPAGRSAMCCPGTIGVRD